MVVQLPNGLLGVRRADPDAVDAHGSPRPAAPGPVSPLLPGKITELGDGTWQLAADDALWPVRVGDHLVDGEGREWLVTSSRLVQTPPLTAEEEALGLDLDLAFVRASGLQVTPQGTEPGGGEFVGRVGGPEASGDAK